MDIIRGEDLTKRLDEFVERVSADERVIINHAGKQVALVSFDDLTFLEEVDRKLDDRDANEVRRRLADPTQSPIPFVPAAFTEQPSQG
jgi:PHD/YefM family antitoxin component YafN of YafNO toxin-antitoxin module